MGASPGKTDTKLRKLEYSIFRNRPTVLDSKTGLQQAVLACCSGGADSVALVKILSKLQTRWGFHLTVAYVHHGESFEKKIAAYREKAEKKVAKLAGELGLVFVGLKTAPRKLDSEEAMRNGRMHALVKYAEKNGISILAQGHHADDLFETRLIRLIRGTGPQGIVAMKQIAKTEQGLTVWRPLLKTTRAEIEIYLQEIGFKKSRDWLEDPSNHDARYLRNVIRKNLIPLIEKQRPGGAKAMSRSLGLLADFVENSNASLDHLEIPQTEIHRRELLNLSLSLRRESLAKWVSALGIREFSRSHVDEMLKRIDTPRKRLSFDLCGRVWFVGENIRLGPSDS